jgi:hypothetical protein
LKASKKNRRIVTKKQRKAKEESVNCQWQEVGRTKKKGRGRRGTSGKQWLCSPVALVQEF